MMLAEDLKCVDAPQTRRGPFVQFSTNGRELIREMTAGPFSSTSSMVVAKNSSLMAMTGDLSKAWCLGRLRGMVPNSNPDAEHPASQALDFSTLGVNPPEGLGTWFDRLFLCK